eukprot:1150973-Pelagomonas_calceolata.AAC.5
MARISARCSSQMHDIQQSTSSSSLSARHSAQSTSSSSISVKHSALKVRQVQAMQGEALDCSQHRARSGPKGEPDLGFHITSTQFDHVASWKKTRFISDARGMLQEVGHPDLQALAVVVTFLPTS